jgi:hypothetical protein
MRVIVFALAVAGAGLMAAPALAGPVLAEGRVTVPELYGRMPDEQGQPPAEIALYLSDTGEAEETAMTLVATGQSGWSGEFALASANTPALAAAAAANGGMVNLDLVANVNGHTYYEPLVRQYENGAWVDGEGATPAALELFPDNWRPGKRPPPMAADGAAGGGTYAYASGCIRLKRLLSTARAWTTIGELHNALDVIESKFSYGRRADSHISKAFSLDGSTWKLKASVRIGNDSGENEGGLITKVVPDDNWGHLLESQFVYGRFAIELWCGSPFAVKVGEDYQIQAIKWVGDLRVGPDVSHLDGRCVEDHSQFIATYGPDTEMVRDRNAYATFTKAATVGFGGVSVELNARSGMSESVAQQWRFGTAIDKHYLCGTNDFPIRAKRVFAGA